MKRFKKISAFLILFIFLISAVIPAPVLAFTNAAGGERSSFKNCGQKLHICLPKENTAEISGEKAVYNFNDYFVQICAVKNNSQIVRISDDIAVTLNRIVKITNKKDGKK